MHHRHLLPWACPSSSTFPPSWCPPLNSRLLACKRSCALQSACSSFCTVSACCILLLSRCKLPLRFHIHRVFSNVYLWVGSIFSASSFSCFLEAQRRFRGHQSWTLYSVFEWVCRIVFSLDRAQDGWRHLRSCRWNPHESTTRRKCPVNPVRHPGWPNPVGTSYAAPTSVKRNMILQFHLIFFLIWECLLGSCLSVDRLSLLRKYLKRDLQIVRCRQAKCWKLVECFSS